MFKLKRINTELYLLRYDDNFFYFRDLKEALFVAHAIYNLMDVIHELKKKYEGGT